MAVGPGGDGVWGGGGQLTPELAARIEQLGYGAIWIGSAPPDLRLAESLPGATERVVVATGIVNMWSSSASEVAASYARVAARYPGRFLLGVGNGHPEA